MNHDRRYKIEDIVKKDFFEIEEDKNQNIRQADTGALDKSQYL